MNLIYEIIERINEQERERANDQSWAIARVGVLIANSFRSDGEPIKESAFLPYPPSEKSVYLMSEQTAKLLLKFARSGVLPPRMISTASSLLDEAKKRLID